LDRPDAFLIFTKPPDLPKFPGLLDGNRLFFPH